MIPVRGGPWSNRMIARRGDRFGLPSHTGGYYSLLCGVYLWCEWSRRR